MKKRTILLIGMLAALAASCIPSLFPLYTEDDLVWDDRIEGTWRMDNGSVWIIERLEHHSDASFMDPKWTEPDEDSEPQNIHYRLTVKEICETEPGHSGGSGSEDERTGAEVTGLEREDSEGAAARQTCIEASDTVEAVFDLHLLELDGRRYVNFYPGEWDLDHGFLRWHMVEVNNFARITLSQESMSIQYFNPDFLEELIENNRIRIDHLWMDYFLLITAPTEDLQKFVIKYSD